MARQHRLWTLPVVVLAAALLAAACGDSSTSSRDVSLNFGYSNTRGKSRQELRLVSGAFADTGYQINWSSFDSNDLTLEALLAGSVDMQELQPTSLANVAGNTKEPWTRETTPLVVVGALRYTTPEGIQIVVRPDSGIDSVADLKGKKVTFTRGSTSNYYLAVKLAEAGLSLADVEQVKLKLSEARAAFSAGEVDAIVAFDFNIVSFIREGTGRVIARSSDDALPLYNLIVVRRGLLDDAATRGVVADMIERSGRFETWVGDHQEEARKTVEELDGLDPRDSTLFLAYGLAESVPLDDQVIASVQQQVDTFFEQGDLERTFDVSVLFDATVRRQ